MLCTHCSKPLELSTVGCPPTNCFLEEGCPIPPFPKTDAFEWAPYNGLSEEGSVLSCIKLISCCCNGVPLLLAGIPLSGRDRRSCRDHFFTSDPPIAYRAFCHSAERPSFVKIKNEKWKAYTSETTIYNPTSNFLQLVSHVMRMTTTNAGKILVSIKNNHQAEHTSLKDDHLCDTIEDNDQYMHKCHSANSKE